MQGLVGFLLLLLQPQAAAGFVHAPASLQSMGRTLSSSSQRSQSALYGIPLIGRFRKKKPVPQVETIRVGDRLPADMDVIQAGTDGQVVQIDHILTGKAILLGTYRRCIYRYKRICI
jgi:hypothetical protein